MENLEEKRREELSIYRRQIINALPNVRGRDIVVWGTRKKGEIAKNILESLGQECKFFISSRPRTDLCYGLPLYKPEVLDVTRHYVISTTEASEVIRFLQRNGFKWDRGFGTGYDWLLLRTVWHDDLEFDGCFVGRGTYGHENLGQELGLQVKRIGRYCSINKSVQIIAHNHEMGYVSTHPFLEEICFAPAKEKIWDAIENIGIPLANEDLMSENKLVEIGNDVWIGTNAVILSGVHVGDGAVIGAGAIVTKDVEPYAVVGGVPAKLIRYRFPREMIDAFLRIKWWDWPIEKIEENMSLFYRPELFCKTFDTISKE